MTSNGQTPTKQLPKLEYIANQPNLSGSLPSSAKSGFLSPPIQQVQASPNTAQMKSFSQELDENQEKRMERLKKLAKYNPLVPIGCLVTIGILGNGLYAMKSKDKHKSQRMMRYRVAAQGITVIALVMGTMATQFLADQSGPN